MAVCPEDALVVTFNVNPVRMPTVFETLWNEPRAMGNVAPRWSDLVLVVVVASSSFVEGFMRAEVSWRPLVVGLCAALALTIPWRRLHPLGMVSIAFGSSAMLHSFALVRGVEMNGLDSSVFLLILPYALLRWASGREVTLGLGVIALAFAAAVPGIEDWPEKVGAGVFLLFPAAVGASVRYRDSAQRRIAEQVRLRERERLARELHDTVAHHVSAIAVQAQAGRAVAGTRPGAPLEALVVIEEAASRTLSEMRHIVRALRVKEEGDEGTRVPAATLADIKRLAREDTSPLLIDVTLTGALDDLDTALSTTLYRLTRESLTNAARHALKAKSVSVHVAGEATRVHLRIVDDGDVVASNTDAGFGLCGMAERVALLGGTLRVGPGKTGGWMVEATLPKRVEIS